MILKKNDNQKWTFEDITKYEQQKDAPQNNNDPIREFIKENQAIKAK